MIRDKKTLKIIEMLLLCPVCKTWTKHIYAKGFMVCGCGNAQQYHVGMK